MDLFSAFHDDYIVFFSGLDSNTDSIAQTQHLNVDSTNKWVSKVVTPHIKSHILAFTWIQRHRASAHKSKGNLTPRPTGSIKEFEGLLKEGDKKI